MGKRYRIEVEFVVSDDEIGPDELDYTDGESIESILEGSWLWNQDFPGVVKKAKLFILNGKKKPKLVSKL
jgi:hypothetical protein